MCDFISFFVSVKNNKIVVGKPTSHSDASVHSAMGDWREAEWTEEKDLVVRVNDDEDKSAYKATVLALAKDRKAFCKEFSPGKDKDGNEFHFNSKGFHRAGDKPAVTWADGSKAWYKDGLQHRVGDKPAEIRADGTKTWFKKGKFVK